jgi:hypothetical protein
MNTKPTIPTEELMERLDGYASALTALRQGVSLDDSERLANVTPALAAAAMREAKACIEALEAALRFTPVPGETFSYQADGYATGWRAAIEQYQANARQALTGGKP